MSYIFYNMFTHYLCVNTFQLLNKNYICTKYLKLRNLYTYILLFVSIYSFSDSTKVKKVTFGGLINPSSSPETGFLLAANGLCFFKTLHNDSTIRSSYVGLIASISQKKQFVINPYFQIFTKQEKYIFLGFLLATKFPEDYFGIGNKKPTNISEKIDYQTLEAYLTLYKKIKRNWYIGVNNFIFYMYNMKRIPNGIFETDRPFGYNGSRLIAFGINLRFDNRNSILAANKGLYLELSTDFGAKVWGSSHNFQYHWLELRKFFPISWSPKINHVLGIRTYYHVTYGDIPFKFMPNLDMRAYHPFMFRDNSQFVFQAEYRAKIWWRIGAVVFAGFGQTASNPINYDLKTFKPNWGTGLRFLINKKENINIRFDYGWGINGQNYYYLSLSESF